MTRYELFAKFRERLSPYVGAILAGVGFYVWRTDVVGWVHSAGLAPRELASAAFNILITLTAFLFSVFVLAIAPGGGFIERIFRTQVFSIFKRYVVEALLLGTLGALACIPFMAVREGAGVVTAWKVPALEAVAAALVVGAAIAFFRVVRVFMVWVGQDARLRQKSMRGSRSAKP